MSGLTQFISKEFMVVPMQATSSREAIEELLEPLKVHKLLKTGDNCLESVLKRERRMSTGVGKGVALPHGLSDQVEDVALVIGISPAGIDFKAPDGMLCHIFVLFVGPASQPDKHFKLLSRFTKLLSDGALRSHLMEARSPDDIMTTLESWEQDIEAEDL